MKNIRSAFALPLAFSILLALSACGIVSTPADDTAASTGMVTLAASTPTELPFTDIPSSADYIDAVMYCYQHGLMMGTSPDKFDPDGSLTRAMTATVFYRMAGEPTVTEQLTFSDAQSGTWYSRAVVWANSTGLMQGYGNHIFGINDPVSVEQLDVILQQRGLVMRSLPGDELEVACEDSAVKL